MNFEPLATLNVWPLATSLHGRLNLFSGDGDLQSIVIRRIDETGVARFRKELWQRWPPLTNVVGIIRRHPRAKEMELGRVALELLKPAGIVPWERETTTWQRLHLAIVTNLAAMMHSGTQQIHMPAGSLWWVNLAWPTSEVNFGEFPRIHLTIEFRPKETAVES